MLATQAVGIDLGTTYSCIAHLNEHGEPVTLPNQEGELSTPSVVLFDENEVIVGTEAQRNAIRRPRAVVHNAKRYIGTSHTWNIDGRQYTPVDISTCILKKLLSAAHEQIGQIDQAVITVPAQFSDAQRHATMEAGHRAGLQRVDIINEPVAASLCHVLGTEGLWFSELAEEQRILVFDLGGGTLDLSVVKYHQDEVAVIASAGDLKLGGIDWNAILEDAISRQFAREFSEDPRTDPESLQFLALEAEQTKRSLSVRPKAALTCQHGGHRKTYQVTLEQFEKLSRHLVDRCETLTRSLLKDHAMGWAHIDVVLLTGGSTRMPMIRQRLDKISGTTPNRMLAPDLSIAHGATYYAGMLLSNDQFARSILKPEASDRLARVRQQSVTARGLGILVRDVKSSSRVPYYLIADNTPLPAEQTEKFGTVVDGQQRVHLQIVESGTTADQGFVRLGECIIDDLPPNLPEGSEVAVTIRYDASARVHVSARDVTSGREASTEIIRAENVVPQLASDHLRKPAAAGIEAAPAEFDVIPQPAEKSAGKPAERSSSPAEPPPLRQPSARELPPVPKPPPAAQSEAKRNRPSEQSSRSRIGGLDSASLPDAGLLEASDQPIALCNTCCEPLNSKGQCPVCPPEVKRKPSRQPRQGAARKQPPSGGKPRTPAGSPKNSQQRSAPGKRPSARPLPGPGTAASPPQQSGSPRKPVPTQVRDEEILELGDSSLKQQKKSGPPALKRKKSPTAGGQKPARPERPSSPGSRKGDDGEEEFWQLVE